MTSYDVAAGIGYLTRREVDCIKQIARLLPHDGPVAVNIGSGAGTSALAVLEECADVMLFDIDLDLAHGAEQYQEAGVLEDQRLRRWQIDSKAACLKFMFKVDYLFVDGDHSEAGIRGDLLGWLPLMNKGGYVLLHDYWPYPPDHKLADQNPWPDVKRVADELMQGYQVVADVDRLRAYQVAR